MTNTRFLHDDDDSFRSRGLRWRRWALVTAIPVIGALVFLLATWNAFFKRVPPGQILVIVAKNGAEIPADQVVAGPGQKGVQREVLGEGWHFVMPVIFTSELHDLTVIPPGKAGVVTALGGTRLPPGQLLAESEDEQGIRRHVLLPGAY